MRKVLVVLATALLVPSLALAAGKPGSPGKSATAGSNAAPKVMYVLRGTLTAYQAAAGSVNGSVTITVKSANHHGASLKGQSLSFAVSSSTRIVGTFKANDNGIVKLRGPKTGLGDPSTFGTLVAKQVIDQGTESS
ncbi:MAG TPA: hypothetical protein VFU56_09630 [Gaiellaceae bacterium]|nr:hypothetical protein [Gaiellaceae bacterium]